MSSAQTLNASEFFEVGAPGEFRLLSEWPKPEPVRVEAAPAPDLHSAALAMLAHAARCVEMACEALEQSPLPDLEVAPHLDRILAAVYHLEDAQHNE